MSEPYELLSPEPAAWDAFIAESDDATVFHTSAWARVWTDEWPGARWRALVSREGDPLAAGLGFIERPGPLGRRVFSMPDGTYGGPLARRGVAAEARASACRGLLQAYLDGPARGALASQLTWRADPMRAPAGFESGFTHVVPLGSGFDATLSHLPHGVRSRVRQADEAGLTLRVVSDLDGVRAFHRLAAANAHRHGSRPRPLSLYQRVFEHLAPRGLARFDRVEHQGQTIGASLHLMYGGRALNWLTVAEESRRHLRPNQFVIARWLRELSAAGYREYDLGGSPADARGLVDFKESWGAVSRPVLVWRRRGWLHRLLRP